MGLHFIDGFDAPGTATIAGELGAKWQVTNSGTGLSLITGRAGDNGRSPSGQALQWASAQLTTRIVRPIWKRARDQSTSVNPSRITIGWAMKIQTLPASDCRIATFEDQDGTDAAHIVVTSTGELEWHEAPSNQRLSTTDQIVEQAWHYVEINFGSNTTGRNAAVPWIRLSLDETVVESGLNVTVCNAVPQTIAFGPNVAIGTFAIDDMYFLDPADSSDPQGNAFQMLGDVSVDTVGVTGDGNDVAWTGVGAGTNDWERIDDALGTDADGDTTYIESKAAGQASLFTFTDLDADTAAEVIHGVAVNVLGRQVEPGGIGYRVKQRRSATDRVSSGRAGVCDSYAMQQQILPTDATDIAWTAANVDASEFGIEGENT